jgi:hypothetical protein
MMNDTKKAPAGSFFNNDIMSLDYCFDFLKNR